MKTKFELMMFLIRPLLICGSIGLAGSGFVIPKKRTPIVAQTNTAPDLRITSPADGLAYAPGALVPYTVTVSDKEDGESKYEEIPSTEVFMELRYFSDPAKAALFKKGQPDNPGYALFKKGDCYNCHAVHAKVIGPSFTDIAAKYKKPTDPAAIAAHIMKGSTGIWGTAVMPTHPDLTSKQAVQLANWILAAGRDGNADYFRGAEGAFHLLPVKMAPKGLFLLKASYTDHGTDKNGKGALVGSDIRVLRVSMNR